MNRDSPEKLAALVQSLNLIPYFTKHPGRSVFEASKDLNMTPDELVAALGRLHCSGVGTQTQELIDLSYELTEGVHILDHQGLDSSVRLTPTEAGALVLTLESLEAMPGLVDKQAVSSAAAKLRSIMDDRSQAIYDTLAQSSTQSHEDDEEDEDNNSRLARALDTQRQVRFDYWSASSNSTSTRTVDPARIFIHGDAAYLTAYERQLAEHRTFRIDRMAHVEVLDSRAYPRRATLQFSHEDPFGFRATERAEIAVSRHALWMVEEYDMHLAEEALEQLEREPAGESDWVRASMPVGSTAWFAQFAVSQADRLRVVGPQTLVDAVRAHASAGQQRYSKVNTVSSGPDQ